MNRTPDFNRLATTVKHQEPDYLPLAELWVDPEVKAAFMNDHKTEFDCRKNGFDVKKDIEFWRSAGYDYLRLSPRYEFFQGWLKDPKTDFQTKTAEFIRSIDYSDINRAADFLPDGMKVIFAPQGGIYEHAWINIGYENFMMGLFEDPDYIRNICDSLGASLYAMCEHVVKDDHVGGIWLSDDIVYTEALIMSPEVIRKFLFPWYEKYTTLAHENGKLFFFHSDGNQEPLLDDYIAMGFDAIHPIEPKSWDVVELKRRVKGKLALLGTVDMDYPLARGTVEEIREYVKQRIREIALGGGFAIGSSNSVAKYIPVENYRAMLETVEKYGRYPIGQL